ncbi:MAG: phenylalanine--tRNA ligase subunit alpha, partial [Acidobacteriota bacterium]
MTTPLEELKTLGEAFDEAAAAATDLEAWDQLRVAWVGRKQGRLRDLMSRMKDIAKEDRRAYGQAVNELKVRVESTIESLKADIDARAAAEASASSALDVTLPGRQPTLGSLHPMTHVVREMTQIFAEMGYSVAEGPEIEDDFHNFEALNFPPDHPARETQDTFFFPGGMLLRTHTSPVQIRTMLDREPPIRVICYGRVYRNDNDLRHSPMFHQIEGLAIGEGVTFGDLKGTLDAFVKRLFSESTEMRLRPSFFPFTEPSAEVDITCAACAGDGCATCSNTGWMEILGCGMVDPRVLRKCGIDPDRYSGFAFGLGVDRVAMNRYGIPNIRTLFDNDEDRRHTS